MKTFAGYQFVATHCNEKDYVLFVDDDVFIKLIELKEQLKKIQSDAGIHGRGQFLIRLKFSWIVFVSVLAWKIFVRSSLTRKWFC